MSPSDSMHSNPQEGLTALILAIKQGHADVVRELVHHGKADINIQEKVIHCHSPMYIVINYEITTQRMTPVMHVTVVHHLTNQ